MLIQKTEVRPVEYMFMNEYSEDNSDLKLYFRLLNYIKPYIFMFVISIVGYIVFASAQPALVQTLKFFINTLEGKQVVLFSGNSFLEILNNIYIVPLLLVLVSIWQGAGSFLGDYYISKVSLGIVRDVRNDIFKKIPILPCDYYDQNDSSKILSLLLYNVTMITGAATDAIKVIFREGFTIIFLFSYLLYMNWKLTLVMVFTFPVIAFIVTIASKRLRKQSKKNQDTMAHLIYTASEYVQNYKAVRIYGGNVLEKRKFKQAVEKSKNNMLKLEATSNAYTPILQLIMTISISTLLYMVLTFKDGASVADLIAYITTAGLLPKPIRQLSEVSETIQKGLAGVESIFQLIDSPSELDIGKIEKKQVNGKLSLKNVSFSYSDGNTVLKGLSLDCAQGQKIAIVGRSGAGKSTLASLLLRFYYCNQGEILLDDININDYALENYRKHVALVSQQVTLFNDTVFNNIAYGELANSSFEQVKNAAKLAYADEFINKLSAGYETIIGENGAMLSGGQRQRLAIARAFLKNAPLLILDEATSALDNESERFVQKAIDNIMNNRTVIIIAHRLSTIEKSDLILVMSEGEVIEKGTHNSLLSAHGTYAKLYANKFTDCSEIL